MELGMDLINRISREFKYSREYQVVIFGITGFTGPSVVQELAKTIVKEKLTMKWAVAGRNKTKMERVLEEVTTKSGINLLKCALLEADVNDSNSLKEMAKRAKLVLNCVGPYRVHGEPVFKACLEAGTHYLDLCGEPQFTPEMQLKYHQEAEKKGVYMVSACGWNSLPADMGTNFLRDNFEGTLNSVEIFLKLRSSWGISTGNSRTWDALVDGVDSQLELFPQVFGKPTNIKSTPRLENKTFFKYRRNDGSGWCVSFPGSDRSVARRSQILNFTHYKETPAEINTFFVIPFLTFFLFPVPLIMFLVLQPFRLGRYLLHKYPAFFSCGIFTKNGPSVEELDSLRFHITFVGKGWTKGSNKAQVPPNKICVTQIEGPHPRCPSTALCLVQSAMTLLNETKSMPNRGGVLTPGAAFRKTTLVERLKRNGLNINIQRNG